jgi:small subunit ribosomal protein S6
LGEAAKPGGKMDLATRPYEGIVILHPDASDEELKAVFVRNKKIIEDEKGTFHNLDSWGKRVLSNPIKKNKRGHFFYSTFIASPQAINEIERLMKIDEKVLRFFHLRLKDGTDLSAHLDKYKEHLEGIAAKEKERELKIQRKHQARRERNSERQ